MYTQDIHTTSTFWLLFALKDDLRSFLVTVFFQTRYELNLQKITARFKVFTFFHKKFDRFSFLKINNTAQRLAQNIYGFYFECIISNNLIMFIDF